MPPVEMKKTFVHKFYSYFQQPKHLVQAILLITTLALGLQFFIHVRQSLGSDVVNVKRPPGVEGFLPIGALMAWKYFLFTGVWDPIHPAAMSIFGFAILLSLLLRNAFCSWFCPIGTLSEWCWKFGRIILGRNLKFPQKFDFFLRTFKYILLGFFLWAVGSMDYHQILEFAQSPYYKLADVKMLFFFTRMTMTTALLLVGIISFSLVIKNFWCRYLCPYGALLGIIASVGPTRISRSDSHCIGCKRCDQACAAGLPVSKKQAIVSPECTGCMDCLAACPKKEALAFTTHGLPRRFWSFGKAAFVVFFLFFLFYFTANITGHWQSSISEREFRMRLQTIDSPEYSHPSF